MSLARKQRDQRLRLAIIDADRCKPDKCGHECEKICPKNRAGAQCVTVSSKVADIEEQHCIGC